MKSRFSKDAPYRGVVIDMPVIGATRLVRDRQGNALGNATCKATDQSPLATSKADEHVIAVKHDESLSADEFSRSQKKSEDGDGRDEMNELPKYYEGRYVSPEFLAWTVSMVRLPVQGHQTPHIVANHNEFNNEWARLATFSQYEPPAGIYVIPIANAGFFLPSNSANLANDRAEVECAFCGMLILITRFTSGSGAMDVHREVSARCSFVQGQGTNNLSIAEIAQTSGAEFLNKYSLPSGGGK